MHLRTIGAENIAARLITAAKTQPILAELVTEHGGDLLALHDQMVRLDTAAAQVPGPVGKGSDTIRAALAAGEELPDLLAAFAGDLQHNAVHAHALRELTELKAALSTEANRRAEAVWDQAFPSLHRKLSETIAEARRVHDQLDGATTADEAIAAGKHTTWARWAELGRIHDQIREAQRIIATNVVFRDQFGSGVLGDEWTWVALVENAEYLDPLGLRYTRTDSTPWIAGLAWLVTHPEAKAWVPTPEQAHDRADALNNARVAIVKDDPRRLSPAQRAFYDSVRDRIRQHH